MKKLNYLSLHIIALISIAILLTIYLIFRFYLIPGARLLFVVLIALFSYTLNLIIQKKTNEKSKKSSGRINTIFLMIIVIFVGIILIAINNALQWNVILIGGLFLIYCWIRLILLN